MAKLVLARGSRRDLLALEWRLIDAIEESLALLERAPRSGRALRGRLRGLHVLRFGAYRIIYHLADSDQMVRMVAIRHRAHAYDSDPR